MVHQWNLWGRLPQPVGSFFQISGPVLALACVFWSSAIQAQPIETIEFESSNAYNYIGGGISDEGWVINSKAQLTPELSARPSAIVDYGFDDVKVLVPVTYDFPAVDAGGGVELLPFGGGGVSFATEGDDHFRALVTGGVDYRISEKWTATGSANVSFAGEADLDVTVGVGYTF